MYTKISFSHPFRKRPLRVALIDSDPMAFSRLSDSLLQMGHEVESYKHPLDLSLRPACHGSSSPSCHDVVLADIVTIGEGHIDRLHELCGGGCRCSHIGLMTEHGMSETDLMRVAKFGARVFLKPIEVPEVSAWLKVVVTRQQAGKTVNSAG